MSHLTFQRHLNATHLTTRLKRLQAHMLPQLTRAGKVMANVAAAAGKASQNRLTELAAAVLNERQWDRLEEAVRELEKLLDQTLIAIQSDLARIRRYSDGIGEACTKYERQKGIVRQALAEGGALSVTSSNLWDRLNASTPQPARPGLSNNWSIRTLSSVGR